MHARIQKRNEGTAAPSKKKHGELQLAIKIYSEYCKNLQFKKLYGSQMLIIKICISEDSGPEIQLGVVPPVSATARSLALHTPHSVIL